MFARATQQEDEELLVPENFAMVEPGVYRSSFPRSKNMRFLKTLGLKSVVALIPEDYPVHMVEFYKQCNVHLFHHGLDGNKWPFKEIDEIDFKVVLRDVLDPANRPLLIHCNKGKHRTGSVVGCLRKIRGWGMSSIVSEYLMMAAPKTRLEDQRYIEAFHVDEFNTFLMEYSDAAAALPSLPSSLPPPPAAVATTTTPIPSSVSLQDSTTFGSLPLPPPATTGNKIVDENEKNKTAIASTATNTAAT